MNSYEIDLGIELATFWSPVGGASDWTSLQGRHSLSWL